MPEGTRVDDRFVPHGEIGRQMAGRGPSPKPCPLKPAASTKPCRPATGEITGTASGV